MRAVRQTNKQTNKQTYRHADHPPTGDELEIFIAFYFAKFVIK